MLPKYYVKTPVCLKKKKKTFFFSFFNKLGIKIEFEISLRKTVAMVQLLQPVTTQGCNN